MAVIHERLDALRNLLNLAGDVLKETGNGPDYYGIGRELAMVRTKVDEAVLWLGRAGTTVALKDTVPIGLNPATTATPGGSPS